MEHEVVAKKRANWTTNEAEEDTKKSFKISAQKLKSILKNTPSPDIKKKHGRALAWQDFHGKQLEAILEYDISEDEESIEEEPWEGEKRGCCLIM